MEVKITKNRAPLLQAKHIQETNTETASNQKQHNRRIDKVYNVYYVFADFPLL